MNRHAYLIMAHDHFDFLEELLLSLDDKRNDIYLHIDLKAGDFDEKRFSSLLSQSRLFFTERLNVHWGGYSQVACELLLLKAASREHYLYYHLLSGSDFPLKSQDYIHAFFEVHAGKEFLSFDSEITPEVRERISLWHFFRESRSPLAEPFDHILTLLQRFLHVNRLRKEEIHIRKGANWFSITDGFVQYILEQEGWIQEHFRRSVCADELFLQTLAAGSSFRDRIYDESGSSGMSNLRYIDWARGNGNSPCTFQEDDRDFLLSLPHLFARKFDKNIFRSDV